MLTLAKSKTSDSIWDSFVALGRHVLVDGAVTEAACVLMRRRGANGAWEYRKPTAAEESDYVSRDAW